MDRQIIWVRCYFLRSWGVVFLFLLVIQSSAQESGVAFPRFSLDSSSSKTTLTVVEDRYFTIENGSYRIALDASQCAISSLYHKIIQQEYLTRPVSLFSIRLGGIRVAPEQVEWCTYETSSNGLHLYYAIHGDTGELSALVSIRPATGGDCVFSLCIQNPTGRPQPFRLFFPALSGLWTENGQAPRNQPVSSAKEDENSLSVGTTPHESHGKGGITCLVPAWQDSVGQWIQEKNDFGQRIGIEYGAANPIRLLPRARFATPDILFLFYVGDIPTHYPFGSG